MAIVGVLVALVIGALFLYSYYGNAATQLATPCCVPPCRQTQGCCMITNDPNTWPSGDRIWLIAHAIAMAEGANIAGSNPDRLNNPGDISDGYHEYGYENHSGSKVTTFPSKQIGWQWLHDKISSIAAGTSCVYSATDSWNIIAKKWSGDWRNWVTNVTATLGVDPNSTLADYLNA